MREMRSSRQKHNYATSWERSENASSDTEPECDGVSAEENSTTDEYDEVAECAPAREQRGLAPATNIKVVHGYYDSAPALPKKMGRKRTSGKAYMRYSRYEKMRSASRKY